MASVTDVRRAAWVARVASTALVLCSLSFGETTAHAQDRGVVRARVQVAAKSACATVDGFWSAVARHTSRLQPAADGGAGFDGRGTATTGVADDALVEIGVEPDASQHVVGTLRVTPRGQAAWQRRLTGATCAEVTDALALVAALAFDPSATRTPAAVAAPSDPVAAPPPPASAPPSNTPPGSASPGSASPGSASPPGTPPATTGASAGSPSTPTPAPVVPRRGPPREEASGSSSRAAPDARWRWAVVGAIGPQGIAADSPVFAYGLHGELANDHAGLAPSFRVGLNHAEGSAQVGGSATDLAWTTGRGAVCPWRADLSSDIDVRPCAGFELGVVRASPRQLANPLPSDRLWAAPMVSGRIRWLLLPSFFVEGEAGLELPLVRDTFGADPSLDLYRAPIAVPFASVAMGVRFP